MTQTNVVQNSIADLPSKSFENEESFKYDNEDNSRIISIERPEFKSETDHYTALFQGVNNLSMEHF